MFFYDISHFIENNFISILIQINFQKIENKERLMRFKIKLLQTVFSAIFILIIIQPANSQQYIVLGWNDLGMHCANKDFSKIAVLPPYNNLQAQIIKKQSGQHTG